MLLVVLPSFRELPGVSVSGKLRPRCLVSLTGLSSGSFTCSGWSLEGSASCGFLPLALDRRRTGLSTSVSSNSSLVESETFSRIFCSCIESSVCFSSSGSFVLLSLWRRTVTFFPRLTECSRSSLVLSSSSFLGTSFSSGDSSESCFSSFTVLKKIYIIEECPYS